MGEMEWRLPWLGFHGSKCQSIRAVPWAIRNRQALFQGMAEHDMILLRRHSESKQKLENNVPTKKLRRQLELHLPEHSPKSRIWKVQMQKVIVIMDSTTKAKASTLGRGFIVTGISEASVAHFFPLPYERVVHCCPSPCNLWGFPWRASLPPHHLAWPPGWI